jgi:hypothetical protein
MPRLTYLPGLLSLCLLWPLGTWYLWRRGELGRERCITMTFPTPVDQDPHMDSLRWEVQPRHPIDFHITGGLEQALPELERFRARMQELARTEGRDTLRIRFGPDARYATVMHAVESCRLNTRVWWLEGQELFTWYASPTPPPDPRLHQSVVAGLIAYDAYWCDTSSREPRPWMIELGPGPIRAGVDALLPMWPALALYALLVAAA